MIFASVKAGSYLVIQDDQVIANIERRFRPMGRTRWTDGYTVTWKDGRILPEWFRNLNEIHKKYNFKNYAGYGKVLRRY